MDNEDKLINPSIAIIIPVYNGENTICRTLYSIMAQTRLDGVSVIIIDDCSTDQTIETVFGFIKNNSNFKDWIVKSLKQNSGVGITRQEGLNIALEEPSIDYIMFIDADDVIAPNAIARIKDKLKFGQYIYNSDFYKEHEDGNYEKIENTNSTWFHGKVYSTKFIKFNKMKIPNVRMNEDSGFNMAAAELTNRIIRDNLPWYYWTFNRSSLTKTIDWKDKEIYLEFYESVLFGLEIIMNKKKDGALISGFCNNLVQCYNFYIELIHDKKTSRLPQCKEVLKEILELVKIERLLESEKFIKDVREGLRLAGPHFEDTKYNFFEWIKHIMND